MKYLLLLAGDESAADALPESERQRILEEHGKFAAMIGNIFFAIAVGLAAAYAILKLPFGV